MLAGERPSGADLPSEFNPQAPLYLDDIFENATSAANAATNRLKPFSMP